MKVQSTALARPVARLFIVLGASINLASAQVVHDEDEHHEIDEIVVNAAALERTVEQLAQPTSVLTGDSLARKQAASIGETVSQELGVSSSYFGPVASRPVIRGQFGERVRILTNALDSLDASALSEDHAVSVSSILADSVEIVRGPATLLYGSGAAGGLVNIVDNRIVDAPLESAFSGALALGTDSATGRESAAARIAFGTENVAFHLDYSILDTDNIDIPGFAESALMRAMEADEGNLAEEEQFGTVENTDSETNSGAAAVTLTSDNGFIGVSVSQHNSEYGVPGHHEDENTSSGVVPIPSGVVAGFFLAEEESVRIDLDQSRIDLKGEYEFESLSTLSIRAGFNEYEHVELEGAEIGTVFDTSGQDVRIEYHHHGDFERLDGAIGFQFKETDFDAIGEEAFVPGSVTEQLSVFAFEEWAVNDEWILQGSVRVERQSIDIAAQPGQDNTVYGVSAGAIWTFSDEQSLAVNYALTQRNPTATELYADGAHVAVERVERGSVTQGIGVFGEETSSNVDVTWRGESELAEWSVTGFINDIDDYILLAPSAEVQDNLQVFNYGQTDARLYGIEAELRVELLDLSAGHIHSRIFSDFVRGEDRQSGNSLPRIPPARYGIGLHYSFDRVEAGVEVAFYDSQNRTAPNELPTDNYSLLSAEVSYAFEDPNVYLFMRGTNLGDEDARQHTSPLKDLLPLPGRSLQLGVRYDF